MFALKWREFSPAVLSSIFAFFLLAKYYGRHRVIIPNRGSMFALKWREFSPAVLSSAHKLLQCYHRQKRDRRRCNSRGIPPQPSATRVISQRALSYVWRNAVTLHILVGKICISFFLFYCEGMLSLVVLWLCDGRLGNRVTPNHRVIILNRGSMLRKRTERNWCKFSRPECATSQRDVTRDCALIC